MTNGPHPQGFPKKINSWIREDNTSKLYPYLIALDENDPEIKQHLCELLLKCIDKDSTSCAMEVLLKIRKASPVISMPSDTLDRICKSISRVMGKSSRNPWSGTVGRLIAESIRSSPQRITPSSFEIVAREGGWHKLGMPDMDEVVPLPWYKKEMERWLHVPAARKRLVDIVSRPRPQLSCWPELFELYWQAVPSSKRAEFSTHIGEKLCEIDIQDKERLRYVGMFYREIYSMGGNIDTPQWESWWKSRVGELWDYPRTLAISELIRGAHTSHPDRPPPGLGWSHDLSKKWGKVLGRMMLETPEKTQIGIHPRHENACGIIMELPSWMSDWGLWSKDIEKTFEQSLAEVSPPHLSLRANSIWKDSVP